MKETKVDCESVKRNYLEINNGFDVLKSRINDIISSGEEEGWVVKDIKFTTVVEPVTNHIIHFCTALIIFEKKTT